MEYLPHEFVSFAKKAGLSDNAIHNLIEDELLKVEVADDEDLSWRELPNVNLSDYENWKLLENYSKIYQLKKIARRRIFNSYTMYYNLSLDKVSLFEINKYNAIRFETFKTKREFIDNLTEKYLPYKSFPYKLQQLDNFSKDEWFVIVSLLEFFIQNNPVPNINWVPDELFIFTPDSLLQIIENSTLRHGEYTWWKHWQDLSKHEIPTIEEIEIAILVLANKALIGYHEESEEEYVYFISKDLVGIINALAWWDRGFMIENNSINTKLFLFQADSLFILIDENSTNYSLLNIEGSSLNEIINNFLSLESQDIVKSQLDSREKTSPHFCSNCGTPAKQGAKFCENCGNKLI